MLGEVEGIDAVKKTGVFYMDQENEAGTTLVNEKACAFAYFENDGTAKCSIEKAHQDGKTDFKKPISCHLYPIRVKQINDLTAINYNEWDICTPACDCGANLDVPVYKFLKEPLIRAFGKEFYNELEVIDKEIKNA
jgi:hypothetical protein